MYFGFVGRISKKANKSLCPEVNASVELEGEILILSSIVLLKICKLTLLTIKAHPWAAKASSPALFPLLI